MKYHSWLAAAASLVIISIQLVGAAVDLGQDCPGNLLVNGGFEEPNTETTPTQIWEPTSNSKWGWYDKIPGMQMGYLGMLAYQPRRSSTISHRVT